MDIHRCRFVAFPPQAIGALAFSHSSNTSESTPSDLRLAVGREKAGHVEIWNPLGGKWVQESVLRSHDGRSVEQLAWTQNLETEKKDGETVYQPGALRLFSIGGSSSVTEWNLSTGAAKRHVEGNSSDIWCFAAQPQLDTDIKLDGIVASQILAAGCSDGSIVLFSTEEDDLRFSRILMANPGKHSKVLSITWKDRNTIIAGYENSTIRVIDVPSRRTLRTMTLGKPAQGTKAVVWTVKCLADGTIVSGDSAGELKIWDATTLSLIQTLHAHQADILDIAFNLKSDQIFTIGVDRRTVAYKLVTTPGIKTKRWTEVSHRRFHRNDVKCVTTYESQDMSVLVTGGVDAAPVVNSIQQGQNSLHRTLPHLPRHPPISSARKGRIFISWWQHNIHVYHVPKRSQSGRSMDKSDYSLLATLQLKGEEQVQSANISEDGHFIIASTHTGVRLFQLRLTTSHGTLALRTRPIDLPPSLNRFGARLVGISPNLKWIYAIRPDNTTVLCKFLPSSTPKEKPSIHSAITKLSPTSTPPSPTLGSYPSTICTATFSHDSRVLATGNLSGTITTWVLAGHEDTTPISPIESSPNAPDSDFDTPMSDSDSDSDDDESETPTIHNQRWTLTPPSTATPYPSLTSPIIVLTFRPPPPSAHASSPSQPNGNIGLHPTRHTPHPISPEHPEPAPQLIAISAEHKLVEFDIYTGKLTDWSRRNQTLPKSVAKVKDRIRGCFWDSSVEKGDVVRRQRLWLFGSTFLSMIDVRQDINPADAGGEGRDMPIDHEDKNGNGDKRKAFSTFAYRDILGAGIIGQEDEGDGEREEEKEAAERGDGEDVKMNDVDQDARKEKSQLEVVIVERPLWSVTAHQPPRFDGGQDWES